MLLRLQLLVLVSRVGGSEELLDMLDAHWTVRVCVNTNVVPLDSVVAVSLVILGGRMNVSVEHVRTP